MIERGDIVTWHAGGSELIVLSFGVMETIDGGAQSALTVPIDCKAREEALERSLTIRASRLTFVRKSTVEERDEYTGLWGLP